MPDGKDSVRDYFDRIFADYAALYVGEEAAAHPLAIYPAGQMRIAKAARLLAETHPAGHVLDAGCGAGHLVDVLLGQGYRVTAIDLAAAMVEQARAWIGERHPDRAALADFRQGDVEHLDFPDTHFDAVIGLGLLEYLPADAPALAEFYRVLRPGGVAILAYRNRLFNLFSMNQYTQDALERGEYGALLAEYRALAEADSFARSAPVYTDALRRQLEALAAAPPAPAAPPTIPPPPVELRQETPAEAAAAARTAGFAPEDLLYFHFHALPPAFRIAAPALYNALSLPLETLDRSAVGALMASGFVCRFRKPEGR